MSAPAPVRWRPRDHLPSVILFAVGLLLSAGLAQLVKLRTRSEQTAALDRRASHVSAALHVSQEMWIEVLHHVESFFRSSDEVTRADFRDFTRPALARHRELAALEWFPLVPAAGRAALEAAAHADGLAAYQIREPDSEGTMVPALPRDEHLPLLYMEPMNDSAMGLDLLAGDLRRRPALAARDSGEPVVSQRIRLVEDPVGVWSVAVHMPIYRRGRPIGTVEERRASFQGLAVAVLRLEPTFEQALAGFDLGNLEITLLDRSAPEGQQLLYQSTPAQRPGDGALRAQKPLAFGGREWALGFRADPEGLV